MASVSRCNVSHCAFNETDRCMAPAITVTRLEDCADCETYRPEEGQ